MSILTDLANKADDLELALSKANDAYQAEASRLAKTVKAKTLDASVLLTRDDGRQVQVSLKNSYGKVNIWESNNGKKGKLLAEGVSSSLHRIKISLANGDI